jgi:hypothetical protein
MEERLNTRRAKNLVLIPWLSLPAVLISQVALWERMPSEIAVQFTTSGQAVTLMSRAGFLLFSIITLLVVLVLCTWKLRKADDRSYSGVLLRYYFTVIVMVLIYFGVLIYNVYN